MKLTYILVFIFFMSFNALANSTQPYELMDPSSLDFAAPVVSDKTTVTPASAGTIVYDHAAGAFFGLTPNGNPSSAGSWLQLGASTSGGVVTSQGNSERVERLIIAVCTSSPCTITSQSGSWVSSVTRAAAGDYTVNIAAGTFSATPTCVCSMGGSRICLMSSTSTSSVHIYQISDSGSSDDNGNTQMICMGPH